MSLFDSLKSVLGGSGKSISSRKIDVEGRFERTRTAFTGTMANFFVAKDHENDGRLVGIKVLDIEKFEQFESRFKGLNKPTESEIAIQMQHPKVVQTYEVGLSRKGQPVLIMEYIDGPSMQNIVVKKQEQHVTGRRLRMIRDMAEGLKYVHSKNFIHRDICPRNFICTKDNDCTKLIDFGLTVPAKPAFMAPGNRTGTPLYMSPEVVRRRSTDQRVDIFSFGVTCFCLIAFEHPWQSEMLNGRAALHHDTAAPKNLVDLCPSVDRRLAKSIMNALNPIADERTPTIDQFLSSIREVEFALEDQPEQSPTG